VICRTVGARTRADDLRIGAASDGSAGDIAMTSPDQTMPTVDTIVSDLWRSFFGTTFDALCAALRGLAAQRTHPSKRISV
jgi:hypothetical protein